MWRDYLRDDLIIDNTERKLLFYKLELRGDQYKIRSP